MKGHGRLGTQRLERPTNSPCRPEAVLGDRLLCGCAARYPKSVVAAVKLSIDEAIRGPRDVDHGKWRARHVGQRRRARRDDGG